MTKNDIITYNKPSVVNMYDRLRNAIQLLRISGDNISQEEINTIIIPIIVEDLKNYFYMNQLMRTHHLDYLMRLYIYKIF